MKRARYLAYFVCLLYLAFGAFEIGRPVTLDVLPKGCLVNAYEFECALQAKQGLSQVTWAQLVTVAYWHHWRFFGHAMCLYSLRNGDVWSYDVNNGSVKLDTHNHDLHSVADSLHRSDRHIWFVQFID